MTAAVDFWLRWAEREGALHESAPDANLVVLPTALQDSLELPEAVVVTADPEVARDEGGVLLASGHPALDRATEDVLRRGDAGHVSLAAPAATVLDAASLLARAREAFPVDHGRIDPAGIPARERVPVLRVGAQVSYTVGLDERFQERAETWVELPGRLSLPTDTTTLLARCPRDDQTSPANAPEGLTAALAAAHERLADIAEGRQVVLAGDAAAARAGEVARTRDYYDAALTTLDRRRRSAAPEKLAMLEAKVAATRAERSRRLDEVEEKFRPGYTIRPFRLHVLWVPALRLPCIVLRGRREFPLALRWLRPTRSFLPMACPNCGMREALVAAKDRLGCRRCLPRAAVVPVLPVPGRAAGRTPTTAAR